MSLRISSAPKWRIRFKAHFHALKHLSKFAGRSSFCTWVTRIVVHEACSRARVRRRFQQLDTALLTDECYGLPLASRFPDPERQMMDEEMHAILEYALADRGSVQSQYLTWYLLLLRVTFPGRYPNYLERCQQDLLQIVGKKSRSLILTSGGVSGRSGAASNKYRASLD